MGVHSPLTSRLLFAVPVVVTCLSPPAGDWCKLEKRGRGARERGKCHSPPVAAALLTFWTGLVKTGSSSASHNPL